MPAVVHPPQVADRLITPREAAELCSYTPGALAQLSFDGAFSRRAPSASLREARLRFERDYIAAVLEQHHWRMSDAARALGIERANLYRKTRQLGISRAMPAQAAVSR